MPWTAYQVILRLHSPLHIGYTTVGYLQRTRPYVIGRALRGALVSRIGRNQNEVGEEPDDPYRKVSKTFAQFLTFTYFYPALKEGNDYRAQFPWENEARFRRRFLSSYTSTALSYPQQTAAEGLLHEVEFISPYTLDIGEPVYLMGYVFVDEQRLKDEKYDWRSGFVRLQLGGERGYGWGEARLEKIEQVEPDSSSKVSLFGKDIGFDGDGNRPRPRLRLEAGARVWAHVLAAEGAAPVSGPVEPLMGREWRANQGKHIGQHLAFNNVHYLPGGLVKEAADFTIGKAGVWQYAAV
jgi:hypothetical protein